MFTMFNEKNVYISQTMFIVDGQKRIKKQEN
uniref:Uncharacterized protein n=1 Tax=Ciona intestinalis TaxID=7719 RepID=H2XPS7_CIOIN